MTNKFRKGWFRCRNCGNYSNPDGKFWSVVSCNLCNYCSTTDAFAEHVCNDGRKLDNHCLCKKFKDGELVQFNQAKIYKVKK